MARGRVILRFLGLDKMDFSCKHWLGIHSISIRLSLTLTFNDTDDKYDN